MPEDVEKEDAVEEKQKEKTFVLCNFRLSPEESVELDKKLQKRGASPRF